MGWKEANSITLRAHDFTITGLRWDPRGALLATISTDLSCKIWREEEGKLVTVHTLMQPYEPVSLAWSSLVGEGKSPLLIAVGTNFGTVCVWTLPDKEGEDNVPQMVMNCQGHSYNPVVSLSIDGSGTMLASGCLKGPTGVVNIWSLHDGSLVYTQTGSGGVDSNGMSFHQTY